MYAFSDSVFALFWCNKYMYYLYSILLNLYLKEKFALKTTSSNLV